MSKFTPGPWAVNDEEVPPIVYSTETLDMVACQSSDDAYADCWHKEEWGKYNARLIAAAPEMYDALTALLDALDANGSCQYERLREEGRAALAKATGND